MPCVGGYDFAGLSEQAPAHQVVWSLSTRPATIVIGPCDPGFIDPKFGEEYPALKTLSRIHGEQILRLKEIGFPVYWKGGKAGPSCVMLPLDRLFDVRLRFAERFWRALAGKRPGADPASLTRYRRALLITQLRALDGKLEGASHSEIARVLFGKPSMSAASWKSHDLRYRTDDTVHRAIALMKGAYRSLLFHPYRRKITADLRAVGNFDAR